MALVELSLISDKLRAQIHDLRETLACLDTENQELLTANRRIKDQNRSLQDIVDKFKARMEEMQKKVEDTRGKMDGANAKIHQLEVQNKSLVKSNEELSKELHGVSCQMALFEDHKAAQEKDLLEMQNLSAEVKKYLKTLEERLEETEHHCHVEKCRSSQLRESIGMLLQLRETRRKDIRDLQGQLEMSVQQATFLSLDQEDRVQVGSLMHEIMEAKLVDVALNGSTRRNVMHWMWDVAKMVAILVFFCVLLLGLAVLYTYFINHEFILESVVMFFSEENIEKMEQILSHYLNWRNDGLLPF